MIDDGRPTTTGELSRWTGLVLSGGTLAAVLIIAGGLAWAVASGAASAGGGRPVSEVIGATGPVSVVAVGLLALALVPLLQVLVIAIAFARASEGRYVGVSLVVLVLLIAALATAAASVGG
jgi:hypothetical protein